MERLLLQVALIVFLLYTASADNELKYPFGDVRNCPATQLVNGSGPLLRMEVLPGIGFDNLRNLDMSQVVAYNYSLCKTTNDGKYLIPDDFLVVPHMNSDVEVYANLIEHWDNYTSLLSSSINIGASVFSLVSGKFSFEYQDVKNHQVNDKAQTTRVQIRHNLYKVSLQPDSQLHPKFKNRLLDIAANLQNNKTDSAEYMAELLVRDYGTHFLTRVDAGAVLAQIDSISDNYVANAVSTSTNIGASASANFLGKFSLSASFSFGTGTVDSNFYVGNRSHSRVLTYGGPPFKPNMTLEEWEQGVPDALVAIDRMGDPLHYLVTSNSLPELPEPTLWEVVDYVYRSVVRYYQLNTHYGCTDRNSPNFEYMANINDGSCKAPHTDYRFGGVYQICQVDPNNKYQDLCAMGAAQVNPLTGDYGCPEGYESVELHNGTVTGIAKKEVCHSVCHHCGWWSRCCQCVSAWVNVLSAANYQAYWCVATGSVSNDTGYMFGGVYTTKTINPVTKAMSCPPHFYPLHIGESMEVCVSDEYDLAYGYSVPFAGFFSCRVGNRLAAVGEGASKVNTKRCPKNYVRFLATVDEGCEINYCANLRSDYQAKPPLLPPFRSKPGIQRNITQSLVIQGPYGQMWVRDDDGNWIKVAGPVMNGQELLQYLSGNGSGGTPNPSDQDSSSSVGAAAAISAVLTLVLCTIVVTAVFGVYKVWKKKRSKRFTEGNYLEINGDNEEGNPTLHSSLTQEEPDHSGEAEA